MRNLAALEKVKSARQSLIDNIADTYAEKLFGTPPSTASGKLRGGTPPDMKLIEKLYK